MKLGVDELVEKKDIMEVEYTGFLKNGLGEVYGKQKWTSGECAGHSYEGEWKNGVREGMGYYEWPDSAKYYGQYKNDIKEGKGTFVYPDGRKYVGI